MQSKEFAKTLDKVLSPSRAITSPEQLRGRNLKLTAIERALDVKGRQVFIYGLRGVGKTSLALTSAIMYQSPENGPINILCSEDDTFYSIIKSIAEQALPRDPRITMQRTGILGSGKVANFGVAVEKYIETGAIPEPTSLNEALSLIEFCSKVHSETPITIIDEFESLQDSASISLFARLLKGLADREIQMKFIFCGIAESIQDIFTAHGSAHRYLHCEELERLSWEARFEIIDAGAQAVGLNIDRTTKIRIASISDGFPYFAHELTGKLLWKCFDRGYQSGICSTPEDFQGAALDAISGIELEYKKDYELAVQKYKTDGEYILWALADTHELKRNLTKIHQSYCAICKHNNHRPLDRKQLSARLSNFKKESFGGLIFSDRRAWFEYRQKMMRGYARLRAAREGTHLDPDHPLA